MPEPDFAGLRTVAMEAARQPEFADIERRAVRVRDRRRAASTGVVAAVVVLVAAGTGYVVGRPGATQKPAGTGTAATPGDPPAGPVRRVVRAYAGDSTHLYAVTQPCDKPPYGACPEDLYGSDDGGRTWHPRTVPPRPSIPGGFMWVLGPRTVVAGGASATPILTPGGNAFGGNAFGSKLTNYVSNDGGATWRRLEDSAEPVDAVPAGHRAFGCDPPSPTQPCTVRVVDPVTGRLAPLANQPPIAGAYLVDAPPAAGLWVTGFDPASHRPALAWSRDGGRIWSHHVFTEADPVPTHVPVGLAPQGSTADGRTAYAMVSNRQDVARIYRTVDGGATWSMFQEGKRVPSFEGFVAGDGAHLLQLTTIGGGDYVASRDGGPYRPERMTGAPGPVGMPQAMAGGGYVATVEADPTAVYLSDNGLSWRRVAIG